MPLQAEVLPDIVRCPRNTAETDPRIGTTRLAELLPYAFAKLGREIPEGYPDRKWSLRPNAAELTRKLGCGVEQLFKFVAVICEKGPENVRGTDLLKRAPGGGKGAMKIKPHLRPMLINAIKAVCIQQGMKPGHRKATRAILDHMLAAGGKAKDLPNRATVTFHSKQPAVLVARAARIEGEHLVRVVANSDAILATNQCIQMDGTAFSSNDDVADIIYVLDHLDRLLGILNVVFGLDVATRGVWTYLPVVGAINSFLVGMAIRRGMLSKDSLLEKYGIQGIYPFCGKPRGIAHDCGSEFLSEHSQRVLLDLDIPFVDVCPPYTPYYRAEGERFHRTAHTRLAEFTRSEVGRRYFRRVPGKEKAIGIRFSDVDRALLEWIVSDYHQHPHEGLGGQTPLQRFEMAANGGNGLPKCGYPMPVEDSAELTWDLLWDVPRVIGHTGIRAFNRTYRDPRLSALFVPGKRSSKKRVSVRVNPYAIGSVFVRLPKVPGGSSIAEIPWQPEQERYPMDPNTARAAVNPSIWEWEAIFADLRKAGKASPTPAEAENLARKREDQAQKDTGGRSSAGRASARDRARREMRSHYGNDLRPPVAPIEAERKEHQQVADSRSYTLLPTGAGGAAEY